MPTFKNSDYENLLSDCINDAMYASTSNRGKIAHIRQLAEIIVRKMLNIPPSEDLMLGQKKVKKKIKMLKNGEYIQKCINAIIHDDGNLHRGNSCTHTGVPNNIEDNEYAEAINCLQELIACIFINYFEEYKFGTNLNIMSNFSLLPPIIRYKTLSYLHLLDNTNLCIIDKLVLSMIKAFNPDYAKKWVNANQLLLSSIHVNSHIYNEIFEQEIYMGNMYSICMIKIEKAKEFPRMYKTFEEAKLFYIENNTLTGADDETVKFKDLMDFVFIGRKEESISIDNSL